MAAAKKGKKHPSHIEEYQELKDRLAHAVLVDAPASDFAEEIMTLDAPIKSLLPKGTVALEANPVEVGLAWVPGDVPVTVHLYLDKEPIPGASGTFEGGLQKFPIPSGMYKPGATLIAMLRFFVGGWKYQVWAKTGGATQKLGEGKDPDPSNPQDDIFVEDYRLP
jgi:hypothetical protein